MGRDIVSCHQGVRWLRLGRGIVFWQVWPHLLDEGFLGRCHIETVPQLVSLSSMFLVLLALEGSPLVRAKPRHLHDKSSASRGSKLRDLIFGPRRTRPRYLHEQSFASRGSKLRDRICATEQK